MCPLIHWFEQLLFGTPSPSDPPLELEDLILRMEAENIAWSHIMLQGGLTATPYQVHGDLNSLTDHLEKHWTDPLPARLLKTRTVSRFWDELRLLLARREATRIPPLPTPSLRDDAILKEVLEGSQEPFAFQSAAFWGEVARRFIHLRRPEKLSALPPASDDSLRRAMQLYDITCQARGRSYDPLAMHLVHGADYVNAAHWQTDRNLEAFMHDRPSHPLTRAVQTLLRRTLHALLHAERPSTLLDPCPRLEALLHNVRVIHESVLQVPHANAPPKLIDVLQRLLALCYRDGLWEKEVPSLEPEESVLGTSLLYLTEQLRIVEREKRLIWGEVSGPRPRERICDNFLYARHKYQ